MVPACCHGNTVWRCSRESWRVLIGPRPGWDFEWVPLCYTLACTWNNGFWPKLLQVQDWTWSSFEYLFKALPPLNLSMSKSHYLALMVYLLPANAHAQTRTLFSYSMACDGWRFDESLSALFCVLTFSPCSYLRSCSPQLQLVKCFSLIMSRVRYFKNQSSIIKK